MSNLVSNSFGPSPKRQRIESEHTPEELSTIGDDLLLNIFSHCTAQSLQRSATTCKRFYTLIRNNLEWICINRLSRQQIALRDLSEVSRLLNCRMDDPRILQAIRHVRYLDLAGASSADEPAIQSILQNCQELESLDLTDCYWLTDLSNVGHLQRLRSLNLSGCFLLSDIRVLEALPHLSSLNLEYCSALANDPALSRLENRLSSFRHPDVLGIVPTFVPIEFGNVPDQGELDRELDEWFYSTPWIASSDSK